MTIMAAFQVLLSRYTGGDDIVVGTPVAGRERLELEGLIGFFVNIILVRVSLGGDPTVRELLRRVRRACLDAYETQGVPFEKLVEELRPERSLSQKPLVQVVFAHHKDLVTAPDVPGVLFEPLPVDTQTAKFDLSLYTWKAKRDGGLTASIEYSADLFDAATVVRMAQQFQTLLWAVAADPDRRLSDLSLVSAEERRRFLSAWNRSRPEESRECLQEALEQRMEASPDSVAVVFEGEHLSYGELNRRANRLAHRLRSLGIGPEARVGLYLERSLDLVVGVVGILKSGGAYVPLDPSYPNERIRFMLKDSGARVVVTHSALAERLSTADVEQVRLDERWPDESHANPPRTATATNLAYVMYTSGSTGRPKGVAVTHGNAVRLFKAAAEHFDFGAADTWTLFHSYAFDFSVWELFGALLHGARLVVIPHWVSRTPDAFYERLSLERVTILNQTPSAFGQLSKVEEEEGRCSPLALRLVIFGGEALELNNLRPWFDRHGDERPRLVNMYGITETTVHVTYRPLAASDLSAPGRGGIGRPLSDVRLCVLDRFGQLVPIGVPGEIHVGGAGLARGYLDRPELTAERFVPDPFTAFPGERLYRTGDRARWTAEGELQYLGRIDHQVKIRGFRIELGEIESVLTEHPAVTQAVVLPRNEPGDVGERLIAYFVGSEPGQLPSEIELRRHVGARLPEYMVPSVFEPLPAMPLTPEGKVDRRALPAPSGRAMTSGYVAPRTAAELKLARIWSEVLQLERVGIEDSFFDLGGHSFLAVQLASRIREEFGVELPLLQIFERPTIADLAETLLAGSVEARAPIDLRSEAVLDPSITFIEGARRIAPPASVFLTGSTGFLGAFLLHELLARTEARIYCLVRAANAEEGGRRIQDLLGSFSLQEDGKSSRIVPVPGDLSRPCLGLSADRFEELASGMDAIYHCGAVVSALYPYSVHKPANVLGTQEVLRLAGRTRVKPVHYVSTTGVVPWTNDSSSLVIREELDLDGAPLPTDGYSQSKWVAERIVAEAGARGFPVCIYRPGRISGHSRTGVSNHNDLFSRMLMTCIELGQVPELDTPLLTDLVPVDYVSQALVHLSMREDSIGRVFHLVNPRPIEWREVIAMIVELGYPLQLVPYASWVANWRQHLEKDENRVLAGLDLGSVTRPDGSWLRLPRFDPRNTLDRLDGTKIDCAPIDAELLATYFSYWVRSGYLHPPTGIASPGRNQRSELN